MAGPATVRDDPALATAEAVALELEVPRLWWLWLVSGILWIVVSLVILQFNTASVKTISFIIGTMFVFSGAQQLLATAGMTSLRWLSIAFGVLFVGAGILVFLNLEKTFAGLADMLGFCFLLVGLWWTIEALISRSVNPLWWIGLLSGILMIVAAFWTSGQFFMEKAYVLLVIAGVWALMHGVTDLVRAFQIRSLRIS